MENSLSRNTTIWNKVLAQAKLKIDDGVLYDTFLEGSYIEAIRDDVIYVVVGSDLAVTVLSGNYKPALLEIVSDCLAPGYDLNFILKSSAKTIKAPEKEKPKFFGSLEIDPQYTFENFVTGKSNTQAYRAAKLAAEFPGQTYNPILFYGDSGLGKTHLLHAIGNKIKTSHPELRVVYIHAQEFMNDFVKFITQSDHKENVVDWFKNSIDVLLVDDVQFLTDKKRTEETFFSIYNHFYDSKKQVVLTSDQHPSLINNLDDRLKTRFVQGLPLSISAPEKETCEAIVRMRIDANVNGGQLKSADFDDDVIEYLAERFHRNIRELEGALGRLIFYATINNLKRVSMKDAVASVDTLAGEVNERKSLTAEAIIKDVAEYYHLASYQLTGKQRTAQIAYARQIAMYLIRYELDLPFKKIGSLFGGKDHSTVMSAVAKIESDVKNNAELRKAIQDLRAKVEN